MQRRTLIIVFAVLLVLAGGIGAAIALLSGNGGPSQARTTSTSTTSAPSAADRAKQQEAFLQLMRDQGIVKGPADEQVVIAEAQLYCRSLSEGLTKQVILDNAGQPDTPERLKSERVLTNAAATMCPENAAKLTP